MGRVFDPGKCFWILGSVLDPGKCFWILESVFDPGKCFWIWEVFVPMGHRTNQQSPLLKVRKMTPASMKNGRPLPARL